MDQLNTVAKSRILGTTSLAKILVHRAAFPEANPPSHDICSGLAIIVFERVCEHSLWGICQAQQWALRSSEDTFLATYNCRGLLGFCPWAVFLFPFWVFVHSNNIAMYFISERDEAGHVSRHLVYWPVQKMQARSLRFSNFTSWMHSFRPGGLCFNETHKIIIFCWLLQSNHLHLSWRMWCPREFFSCLLRSPAKLYFLLYSWGSCHIEPCLKLWVGSFLIESILRVQGQAPCSCGGTVVGGT